MAFMKAIHNLDWFEGLSEQRLQFGPRAHDSKPPWLSGYSNAILVREWLGKQEEAKIKGSPARVVLRVATNTTPCHADETQKKDLDLTLDDGGEDQNREEKRKTYWSKALLPRTASLVHRSATDCSASTGSRSGVGPHAPPSWQRNDDLLQ